jgi:hypothetical protein
MNIRNGKWMEMPDVPWLFVVFFLSPKNHCLSRMTIMTWSQGTMPTWSKMRGWSCGGFQPETARNRVRKLEHQETGMGQIGNFCQNDFQNDDHEKGISKNNCGIAFSCIFPGDLVNLAVLANF